ncbi:Serine/threonine-protein kinase TOR [Camellia lanceoleosa]|uniref:Serine/threonine-protein kinase TOR n=1 Tax=Camellia lanceoleosa TaxID=1840588 RepID=A0ACC0HP83_9ERIC|nr:Serine/threonine-protein kinase TOR [Camellia lanceoleosa]
MAAGMVAASSDLQGVENPCWVLSSVQDGFRPSQVDGSSRSSEGVPIGSPLSTTEVVFTGPPIGSSLSPIGVDFPSVSDGVELLVDKVTKQRNMAGFSDSHLQQHRGDEDRRSVMMDELALVVRPETGSAEVPVENGVNPEIGSDGVIPMPEEVSAWVLSRINELFGLVNTLLENSRNTAQKDLSIQRYVVIPLSPNNGLIGWVPNCDTLHHLIRSIEMLERSAKDANLNQGSRLLVQDRFFVCSSMIVLWQILLKSANFEELKNLNSICFYAPAYVKRRGWMNVNQMPKWLVVRGP